MKLGHEVHFTHCDEDGKKWYLECAGEMTCPGPAPAPLCVAPSAAVSPYFSTYTRSLVTSLEKAGQGTLGKW